MAMLMMMRQGNYTNRDAVENVIRYITRTRRNEDRRNELIAWGGYGVGCYATPELIIEQFECVQNVYGMGIRGGRRMFHETLNIRKEEFEWLERDYGTIYRIAMKCAEYYYSVGHQVVFAVHYTENEWGVNKGVHIHFAVNSVNFQTGNKWHTNRRESYKREENFNLIIRSFMKEGYHVPLFFR